MHARTGPLTWKLEAIRKTGTVVSEITLAPLAPKDVTQLTADALHCEPDRVTSLVQMVYDKTAGIHPDDQPGFRELIQTAIREKAE